MVLLGLVYDVSGFTVYGIPVMANIYVFLICEHTGKCQYDNVMIDFHITQTYISQNQSACIKINFA